MNQLHRARIDERRFGHLAAALPLIATLACGGDRDPAAGRALPAWPLTASCREESAPSDQGPTPRTVVCELGSRDGIPIRIFAGTEELRPHLFEGDRATLTFAASDLPPMVTELRFTAGATELRVPFANFRLDTRHADDAVHVAYTLCPGCTIELDGGKLATETSGSGTLIIRAEDLSPKYYAGAGAPKLILTIVTASGERFDERLTVSTAMLLDRMGPALRAGAGGGLAWSAPLAGAPPWPAILTELPAGSDPRERLRALGGLTKVRDAQIVVIAESGEDGGQCPGLYRDERGDRMTIYRATPWSRVVAFEARTGKEMGRTKLMGKRRPCPSSTWEPRVDGDPPDDRAIEKWLATLKPPAK